MNHQNLIERQNQTRPTNPVVSCGIYAVKILRRTLSNRVQPNFQLLGFLVVKFAHLTVLPVATTIHTYD